MYIFPMETCWNYVNDAGPRELSLWWTGSPCCFWNTQTLTTFLLYWWPFYVVILLLYHSGFDSPVEDYACEIVGCFLAIYGFQLGSLRCNSMGNIYMWEIPVNYIILYLSTKTKCGFQFNDSLTPEKEFLKRIEPSCELCSESIHVVNLYMESILNILILCKCFFNGIK